MARGVRRGAPCELVVRFRDEWALAVVRVLGGADERWTLVRSGDSWTEEGTVPEALRDVAQTAPRVLLGTQRAADALEIAFDGLRPDPARVAAVIDAVVDAATLRAPYR